MKVRDEWTDCNANCRAKSTLTWCIYEAGYFLGSIRSIKGGSQHKAKLDVLTIAIMENIDHFSAISSSFNSNYIKLKTYQTSFVHLHLCCKQKKINTTYILWSENKYLLINAGCIHFFNKKFWTTFLANWCTASVC